MHVHLWYTDEKYNYLTKFCTTEQILNFPLLKNTCCTVAHSTNQVCVVSGEYDGKLFLYHLTADFITTSLHTFPGQNVHYSEYLTPPAPSLDKLFIIVNISPTSLHIIPGQNKYLNHYPLIYSQFPCTKQISQPPSFTHCFPVQNVLISHPPASLH